jgi:hypothetical protein
MSAIQKTATLRALPTFKYLRHFAGFQHGKRGAGLDGQVDPAMLAELVA